MKRHDLLVGQQQARMRWGTYESGAAFDRKKIPYLSEEAQAFLAHQAFCVIAGLGSQQAIRGLLAMGAPGFVQVLDQSTCLLHLDHRLASSSIFQEVRRAQRTGRSAQLGLFFISHASRERLCVQGTAEIVACDVPILGRLLASRTKLHLRLHIRQAFFHCSKYIRTRIAGLTLPVTDSLEQDWQAQHLMSQCQHALTEAMQDFLAQQVLCFLCTRNQQGQCAVNHRGGKPGFLLPVPPDPVCPGGLVLLPDYAGNGAFEAIGNILETRQAALLVPHYPSQVALCLSGPACIVELDELSRYLSSKCIGAERVVALLVQQVETQSGDWSVTLAYERARAQTIITRSHPAVACPL
jgi:uncharacterized protein